MTENVEAATIQEETGATKRVPKYQQMIVYQGRMTRQQRARLEPIRVHLSTEALHAAATNPRLKTERITDNTLIRVGIEIIISIGHQLEGTTERQLVESAKTILGLSKQKVETEEQEAPEPRHILTEEPTIPPDQPWQAL